MTKAEATEILKIVAEAYPSEGKWSAERLHVWVEMLQDLPVKPVRAAVKAWIASEKWCPSIAEIREFATGSAALPPAAEAWAEVTTQIQMCGSWDIPRFSSELIGRAVEAMGGWRQLCVSENPMADRAHFLRIYEQLEAREKRMREIPGDVRWLLQTAAEQIGALPKVVDIPGPAHDPHELLEGPRPELPESISERFDAAHLAAMNRKLAEEKARGRKP